MKCRRCRRFCICCTSLYYWCCVVVFNDKRRTRCTEYGAEQLQTSAYFEALAIQRYSDAERSLRCGREIALSTSKYNARSLALQRVGKLGAWGLTLPHQRWDYLIEGGYCLVQFARCRFCVDDTLPCRWSCFPKHASRPGLLGLTRVRRDNKLIRRF